jgi:hypothetical protein
MSQQGSMGLVAAAIAMLSVVVGLLVVDFARVVAMRAQLTAAADAAALAAAPVTFADFGTDGDPVAAARKTADANGARLVECECRIDRSWADRRVTVRVGGDIRLTFFGSRPMTATAAAEFRPVALGHR